jgi:hypothetical protein
MGTMSMDVLNFVGTWMEQIDGQPRIGLRNNVPGYNNKVGNLPPIFLAQVTKVSYAGRLLVFYEFYPIF